MLCDLVDVKVSLEWIVCIHLLKIASDAELSLTTGLDKKKFQRKIVNIFLPIFFSICFGSSKEPSH